MRSRAGKLLFESLEQRQMLSAAPHLVKDINAEPAGTLPRKFLSVGSQTFFVADDGQYGEELWVTDGSAAGTHMVKDIYPGLIYNDTSSFPASGNVSSMTAFKGELFFSADDGVHGPELWKSDGTEAGTVMVKDALDGQYGSNPENLFVFNGQLYFSGWTQSGYGLWRTDGTNAGTALIKTFYDPNARFGTPLLFHGAMFFTENDTTTNTMQLWTSDGTPAGTQVVHDITIEGDSNAQQLLNTNGALYFASDHSGGGFDLWKSDGTDAGTQIYATVPGEGSSGEYFENPIFAGSRLVFLMNRGGGKVELWSSDGTQDGTSIVHTFTTDIYNTTFENIGAVGNTVVFSIFDGNTETSQLWRTDGTLLNTAPLVDLEAAGIVLALPLTSSGGKLFFDAYTNNVAPQVWETDGTSQGTFGVDNAPAGTTSVAPIFYGDQDAGGTGVWITDATAAGTHKIATIDPETVDSDPQELTNVNGTLFFTITSSYQTELWKSDGTEDGTVKVADLQTYYYSPSHHLTSYNGELYFTQPDDQNGWQLWKSNGTPEGTTMVADIAPPNIFGSVTAGTGSLNIIVGGNNNPPPPIDNLTVADGQLFFTAADVHNTELWVTDGSPDNTHMVKDLNTNYGSAPHSLVAFNGLLYFRASDSDNNRDLWATDGTDQGTVLVKQFPSASTSANSSSEQALVIGTTLYFVAYTDDAGYELWRSDGTDDGTSMVADFTPGPTGSYPNSLTDVNGTLFFFAADPTDASNEWLWKTTGIADTTIRLAQVIAINQYASTPATAVVGDKILFAGYTSDNPVIQLWSSDGTPQGTGVFSSVDSGELLSVDGRVFMQGYPSSIWVSNGTYFGTNPVIRFGPNDDTNTFVAPHDLTAVGSKLFFAADDGLHGTELWMLDADDNTPPTSAVAPLPATQNSANIQLSWSGDDGADGSGISSYDIYVSTDGAAYAPFLQQTDATSATFTGQYGHTYSFYSVATDRLSNVEAVPRVPDTTVSISDFVNQVVFDAGTVSIAGTAGVDTIVVAPSGNNLQVTLNGRVISNNIALASINAIEVFGRGGADTITITNIAKPVNVEGGDGADRLVVNGHAAANAFVLNGATLTVNGFNYTASAVETLVVNGQGAADTFTMQSLPGFAVTFAGGAGADTVHGPDAASTWNITAANAGALVGSFNFTAVENLDGGLLDDTFNFGAGKTFGGRIDGGNGDNTLNYAAFQTAVKVNMKTQVATGTIGYSNIDSFVGGTKSDTLVGSNGPNNWDLSGPNSGSINDAVYSGFENLTGGTLNDTFIFVDGGSVSGKIDGAGGSNSADYSGLFTPVIFNRQTNSATSTGGYLNIQKFLGSAASMLVGQNVAATWNITGVDSGTVGTFTFVGVNNLTGGTAADKFVYSPGAEVDGLIDGKAGIDTLSFASFTTPVYVTLAVTPPVNGFINLENFIGGTSGFDSLYGDAVNNTWNITGNNSGKVNNFTFSGFEGLYGNYLNDTFIFADGKGVSFIDGGGGRNTLNYAAYKTGVNVNLSTGSATNISAGFVNISDVIGGAGANTLTGDSNNNYLVGGPAADTIVGGGGSDILMGKAGADHITGSEGRDLIFGGDGADVIDGAAGEDLIISGMASFGDTRATIDNLFTFWNRTDLDYGTRVTQLRGGVTGIPKLIAANVTNDTFSDNLTGGADLDWYFAKTVAPSLDTRVDLAAGEQTG